MKTMANWIAACFIFILTSVQVMAQVGSIKGQLIDAETSDQIIGANIYLKGSNIITVSDFEGNFILENVSVGEQTIVISYIGFNEISQAVTVKEGAATSLGTIKLEDAAVGIKEINVVASVAIDRKTPIAVSTISAEEIENKVGNQEFPEIMRSTPSVYVTKQGGGFGDSRINVRGFDQRNLAVMINGIPVNDMENGWVYWSNWAGLSDVTRTIQVQRGLGASKLAISSVGGTINLITKTVDQKEGGLFKIAYGNNNYMKAGLTLSSGLMDNGWAITASGAYTRGDGYIDGTAFEGGSYFGTISKQINEDHQIVLTAFGAMQKHGQRTFRETLETYDSTRSLTYNGDWGYDDDEAYTMRENFYHKPQISLSHYWNINQKMFLSTAAYVSFGRGGGTGDRGRIDGKAYYRLKDSTGQVQFTDIKAWNTGQGNIAGLPSEGNRNIPGQGRVATEANGIIRRSSINSHNWLGALSTLKYRINENFDLVAGVDVRGYRGIHYRTVNDLLGNDVWFDTRDINNQNDSVDIAGDTTFQKGAFKQEGDKIHYDNDGLVNWQGAFMQLEYTSDMGLSAFFAASGANTFLQRIDRFQYEGDAQKSEVYNFLGFTTKAGVNYNIDKNHNVFINGGYFSRAPTFDAVFPNFNNTANESALNEKVAAVEVGYGFRSRYIAANVNLYHTRWMDKTLFDSYIDTAGNRFTANIIGLNATHQGVEFDMKADLPWVKGLSVSAMASVGDWQWSNNVNAAVYDDNNAFVDSVNVYSKGLKVGDAAQTTMAVGLKYRAKFGLGVDVDYWYGANMFANFDPIRRTSIGDVDRQALKLPAYGLLDAGVSYKFEAGGTDFLLRFNMNNVLDTKYVADADDYYEEGMSYDERLKNARGYYGFGRTWNVSLRMNF